MKVHLRNDTKTYCNIVLPVFAPGAEGEDWRYSFAADEVNCWRCICVYTGKEMTFSVPDAPQHALVRASHNLPQKLCEFVLEFCPAQGVKLVDCSDGGILTENEVTTLAAQFVDIDILAYDAEKEAALAFQRKLNELQDWAKTEGKALMLEKAAAASK